MLPSPTEGSTCGGDLVTASMSTVMEAQHHGAAPQPTESGSGSRLPLPSSALVLRRSGSECFGSSSFVDPGPVELPEPPSDYRVPLPAPPPPVTARETAPCTKNPRVFRANPKVHIEQSKRFANGVLEEYNKRMKIKFELLDVVPVIGVPESHPGSRFLKHDAASAVRKNVDFAHCFACNQRILHPKGEKYIAGHRTIPNIYGNPCY